MNDFKVETEFGYCYYSFEEDYVHVYDLYVYPKFRRLGHARELLELAIKGIRDTGYNGDIQIVALPRECSISGIKLKNFYKSMGFIVFEAYL
jgi:ribosomal protein S18 acetylase RimI-like enzyme